MGMMPRQVPVTREDVHGWLAEFKKTKKGKKYLRTFLVNKLQERELGDATVNTVEHQDLSDETALVDMILMDLDSYV